MRWCRRGWQMALVAAIVLAEIGLGYLLTRWALSLRPFSVVACLIAGALWVAVDLHVWRLKTRLHRALRRGPRLRVVAGGTRPSPRLGTRPD